MPQGIQPQAQSQTPSQLDPQLVTLAQSIRQNESGNNPKARGASGEYGAYQWTPDTWKAHASAAGVNVPLEQSSLEQQNEVAYKTLANWKQQHPDWNIGNYASAWNAGEGNPDAYKNGNVGVNSKGVSYDTPGYAAKIANTYHQLKAKSQGQQSGGVAGLPAPSQPGQQSAQQQLPNVQGFDPPTPPSPSQTAAPDAGSQQSDDKGFIGNLTSGNIGGALGDAGNFLFPIAGDIKNDFQGTSKKNALQQVADAGLSALPFIPFAGEYGEAIRGAGLVGDLALGGAAGGLSSVAQGDSPSQVVGNTLLGAGTGGVLHGAGSLISKAAETLPQRFVSRYIPKLSEDTAAWAAKTKNLGSPSKMLAESDASISRLEPALGKAISDKANSYVQPSGQELLGKIASQFNSEGVENVSAQDVAENLQKLVPLKKGLIQKLVSGQDMSLTELHSLNSAIGKATYKSVFDNPTVKAGKVVGNAAYHAIGDLIKQAAPDSGPIFDELSKEYSLNAGLRAAVRTASKSKQFGLPEILSLIGGFQTLGAPGAVGALALEKGIRSPTVNLKTAGLIRKLGSRKAGLLGKELIPQVSRNVGVVRGLIPSENQNQ